jgi:hypothetical protein
MRNLTPFSRTQNNDTKANLYMANVPRDTLPKAHKKGIKIAN